MNMNIVRENQDLEFPDNVQYDFVYWGHVPENYSAMIEAVKDCDIVGMENVGPSGQGFKHDVVKQYRDIQDRNNYMLREGRILEKKFFLRQYRADAKDSPTDAFVEHYTGSGKKFYYIDAWEHSNDPDHITQQGPGRLPYNFAEPISYRRSCEAGALYMDARESIVLRQLADIGRQNAPKDGMETKRIGVVLGAAHSFVSVAARALGAQVSRRFVGDYSEYGINLDHHLIRTMRLYGPESEQAEKLFRAQFIARHAVKLYSMREGDDDIFNATSISGGPQYRCTDSLIAMDLCKDEPTEHDPVKNIRDYIEDRRGERPLDLTDTERVELERLHRQSVARYVEKADKLAGK